MAGRRVHCAPKSTCPIRRPGPPTGCRPCKSRSPSAGSCRLELSCEDCWPSSLRAWGSPPQGNSLDSTPPPCCVFPLGFGGQPLALCLTIGRRGIPIHVHHRVGFFIVGKRPLYPILQMVAVIEVRWQPSRLPVRMRIHKALELRIGRPVLVDEKTPDFDLVLGDRGFK